MAQALKWRHEKPKLTLSLIQSISSSNQILNLVIQNKTKGKVSPDTIILILNHTDGKWKETRSSKGQGSCRLFFYVITYSLPLSQSKNISVSIYQNNINSMYTYMHDCNVHTYLKIIYIYHFLVTFQGIEHSGTMK